MNDCYLNFLVSFRALFSLDVGANLVNSKQTIGIILPDLSLLGYAVPVESFGIGLFVILFTYLIIEYNVQLLSHEKFKIAMNMLHTAHTPLILLRNQLEELKTGNLPEPLSQQVEEALGYAECIIYCNRNIATLNKVNKRIPPKTSTVNLELSTYVTSIVNQCRAHANSRQIRLTVGECSDCVSCRINENIMTAALQHLINKMILISESGCCISINVTHTMNSWQLQISNNEIAGQRAGKMFPFIPIIFPVYGYSDLWTVRKIIRLHGGKITGCRHGKAATFQIVIPTDCHCQNQSCPVLKHSSAKTKTQIDDSCSWSNAYLLSQYWSIGINVSYLFGNIVLSEQQNDVAVDKKMHARTLYTNGGVQYHYALNHDLSYTLGVVYGHRQKMDVTNEKYIVNDKTQNKKKQRSQKQSLPQYFGIGGSLQYKKWTYALDYTFQQYTSLTSVDSRIEFQDVNECRVGICYFPNGYSSDGFWKQVSYKAGIDLSNSYMRINGSSGVSLRFNAGLGLPVFRGRINIGIFYDRLRLKKEILNRDVIGATLSLTLGEIFYRGKLK